MRALNSLFSASLYSSLLLSHPFLASASPSSDISGITRSAEWVKVQDAVEYEYFQYFSAVAPSGESPNYATCKSLYSTTNSQRLLKGLLNHKFAQAVGRQKQAPRYRGFCTPASLGINVHYHVVSSDETSFALVSQDTIATQHDYLNNQYLNLDIQFHKASVNYYANHEFTLRSGEETSKNPFRKQSRVGSYSDLNVWILESAEVPEFWGFASFPSADLSAEQKSYDGVAIGRATLPFHGNTQLGEAAENQGATNTTLVHQVGHWLGLPHVFDDSAASAQNDCQANSDLVSDAPQYHGYPAEERFKTHQVACNSGSKEPELVTNCMSLSAAACTTTSGFTTGQKARVFSRYLVDRRGLKNLSDCDSIESKSSKKALVPDNILKLLVEDDSCWTDEALSLDADFSIAKSLEESHPFSVVLASDNAKSAETDSHAELRKRLARDEEDDDDDDDEEDDGEDEDEDDDEDDEDDEDDLDGLRELVGDDEDTKSLHAPPTQDENEDGDSVEDEDDEDDDDDEDEFEIIGSEEDDDDDAEANVKNNDKDEDEDDEDEDGDDEDEDEEDEDEDEEDDENEAGTTDGDNNEDNDDEEVTSNSSSSNNGTVTSQSITCPSSCKISSNSCHSPTAQTCIYPDPFATSPVSFCVCRPGFRAAADPAGNTTVQWRLPINGIEKQVYVAEGVECNTPCSKNGCSEVEVLDKSCVYH